MRYENLEKQVAEQTRELESLKEKIAGLENRKTGKIKVVSSL